MSQQVSTAMASTRAAEDAFKTAQPTPDADATKAAAQKTLTAKAEQTAAAAATQTAQPTPDADATKAAARKTEAAKAEAAASAVRACLTGPNTPQDWAIILCDAFNSAANGWGVRSIDDDYLTGGRSIDNGKYEWTFTSKKGVASRIIAKGKEASDFYAAVSAQQLEGDPSISHGLVFRDDGTNYYFFQVYGDGRSRVSIRYNNEWQTLFTGNASGAFIAGQPNLLAVESQGDLFAVSINNQVVGTFRDSRLAKGRTGLAINIPSEGKKLVIDFDQFLWLEPKANSKPRVLNAPSGAVPTSPPVVVQPTQPPSSGCQLDPGNAGILVVNQFDGLMTFTMLNHEYKLDPHTELLVQMPGGQEFTVSVSVVGVGKTSFGPLTLQAGECKVYKPSAG